MLLKGIRILDFTTLLPGPMCSLFLADLGAEVIKIEALEGDMMRFHDNDSGKSPLFEAINRNKKSVCIDLKSKEGKKIAAELAKKSDVIIESMRPGKMEDLGLGYKEISKINKRIVYCSLSAYGQKEARKDKAGHDVNFLALSGSFELLKSKEIPGLQFADTSSSLVAAVSILAALNKRNSAKKGEFIDVAILDSMLAMISIHIALHSASNKMSDLLLGKVPCYNVYRTKDSKLISIAAVEGKFWENFCNAFNAKGLLKEKLNKGFVEKVANLISSKTFDDIKKLNDANEFCMEPLLNFDEVLNDKALDSRKILLKNDVVSVAFPAKFGSVELKYNKSPKLGENTDEILSGLKYSKSGIMGLKRNKVVR